MGIAQFKPIDASNLADGHAVESWSKHRHDDSEGRLAWRGHAMPEAARMPLTLDRAGAPSARCEVDDCQVVCLEVPGKIECRDVVMRTVSAACQWIGLAAQKQGLPGSDFQAHVVSAVGEAYNNIVLHGYAGRRVGPVQVEIENGSECVRVVIKDTGASFDPSQAASPDLAALPESGLGIFVMRSMVDELSYVAGSPNVLTLVKRLDGGGEMALDGADGDGTKVS